jgi:hypothetical protein
MNAIVSAFLATSVCYGAVALGASIVLCWQPETKRMQQVMAVAIGLMLSAVLGLFTSAHDAAVKKYGHLWGWIPLAVGTLVATATLVAFDRLEVAVGADDLRSPQGSGHVELENEEEPTSPTALTSGGEAAAPLGSARPLSPLL